MAAPLQNDEKSLFNDLIACSHKIPKKQTHQEKGARCEQIWVKQKIILKPTCEKNTHTSFLKKLNKASSNTFFLLHMISFRKKHNTQCKEMDEADNSE